MKHASRYKHLEVGRANVSCVYGCQFTLRRSFDDLGIVEADNFCLFLESSMANRGIRRNCKCHTERVWDG